MTVSDTLSAAFVPVADPVFGSAEHYAGPAADRPAIDHLAADHPTADRPACSFPHDLNELKVRHEPPFSLIPLLSKQTRFEKQ